MEYEVVRIDETVDFVPGKGFVDVVKVVFTIPGVEGEYTVVVPKLDFISGKWKEEVEKYVKQIKEALGK
ncbi:MAG: hypothetical protein J7J51_05275 [Candidatus Omnitrophica bacterium]|nr:hypothetical protein [Candidatus Omnitrophota bacterium]